nr:MAG TPA: hypothetical protein [Inoviridae sp.]
MGTLVTLICNYGGSSLCKLATAISLSTPRNIGNN